MLNKTIIYSISDYLTRAVESSYKKAKKDVVKNIRRYIVTRKTSRMVTSQAFDEKFFDDKLPSYLSIDYSSTDEKFLNNFRKEVFTVACVGAWELEEKMKEIANNILELPETDTRDRKKLFVKESQDIISRYIPDGDKIPPAGWLKTNLQTAVNSSYNASQWQKLHDPAVMELYPAYKYKTREDNRVRPEHAILDNAVYRSDDIIWEKIYPPNGWNCRCYVNYLSAEDIQEPGNKPNDLTVDPAEVNRLVKEANISKDFQRNSGIDGHIYDKWINAKLKEMPESALDKIKRLVTEYVSIMKAPDYGIEVMQKVVPEGTALKDYAKDIGIDNKLLEVAEKNIKILRYVNSGGSQFEDKTGTLTLDVSRHVNDLFKKYDITHELSHILHLKNNIITYNFVDKEIVKLYDECKDVFFANYKSESLLRDNYLGFRDLVKGDYDIEIGDYKLFTSNAGDLIASLTKGEYGRGHNIEYWGEGNNAYLEFFAGSSVNHLLGNIFFKKQFPILFEKTLEIKKYYE